MAKQNQQKLEPGMEIAGTPGEQVQGIAIPPTVLAMERSATETIEVKTYQISIPVGELNEASRPSAWSRRVDVVNMTIQQLDRVYEILRGLKIRGACLASGKEVSCPQDVIKWILEQE